MRVGVQVITTGLLSLGGEGDSDSNVDSGRRGRCVYGYDCHDKGEKV